MSDYIYILPIIIIPAYITVISLVALYLFWKEGTKKSHHHVKIR